MRIKFFFLPLFIFFLAVAYGTEPIAVYLTLEQNPSTSIRVHWLTESDDPSDLISLSEETASDWKEIEGVHYPLPDGHSSIFAHTARITDLKPEHTYRFRLNKSGKIYTFRTLPDRLEKPFKFVVGGDLYHGNIDVLNHMNEVAGKKDPYFLVAGGDLAYSTTREGNQPDRLDRWIKLLRSWQEHLVTSQGHMIPIVPVIGNEDTKKRYDQTPRQAPLFYALFAKQGEDGYGVIDVGDFFSLFYLDSQHTHKIYGDQERWISESLEMRHHYPHKFAVYHFPAFPSVRSPNKRIGQLIRRYWIPYFEKYGIIAAFEHHDHSYKRTHPIKNYQVDPHGILYLGDGGMGVVRPRKPVKSSKRWYLAKTARERHFFLITLHPDGSRNFEAVNQDNVVFDQVSYPH